MGTKNQPMFPKGVVYEGVSEEPTYYRGESGANDSIIPTCDNLFEMTALMPSNPLTEILKDFRTYRPGACICPCVDFWSAIDGACCVSLALTVAHGCC